jgi:hypothetical protein
MTLANFKSYVAAYVNRTAASLVVDGQDVLLQAINDARRQAQRDHTFNLCKTEDAYLSTHMGGVDWTTGAKTTPGGGTAVLLKQVHEVWMYNTATIGASTHYLRTARVPFTTSFDFRNILPTQGTNEQWLNNTPPTAFASTMFAYATGVNLYVTSMTTATPFKLVATKWLSELADGDSPDIFLTFYVDWLLLATLKNLNVYLKDSERFPIDQMVMKERWESVKQHDGSQAQSGEGVNLD